MEKVLILVRGLPGAGKTTFAHIIESEPNMVFSADDYFMDDGEYKFDASLLDKAHKHCLNDTERYMRWGAKRIIVANTFTTKKEMKPYFEIADKHGYTVFSVIVENRHGNKSIHNVPKETVNKMNARFDIQL